jgi:DNA-directed RNA polymerase specialized sigma24 family protein
MENSSEPQTANDVLYSLLLQIAGQRKRKHHGLQRDTCSLAHDLWIRFVERRSEIAKPEEWLSKTLTNIIFDYYRLRQRTSTSADTDIQNALANKMQSHLVEKERRCERLNQIFEAMDRARKEKTANFEILSLYVLGYSKQEIERKLGKSRRDVDKACSWLKDQVKD